MYGVMSETFPVKDTGIVIVETVHTVSLVDNVDLVTHVQTDFENKFQLVQ